MDDYFEEHPAPSWAKHFRIQSTADLDFVVMESHGLPVGMSRSSSPEFRRRIVAAALSHFMGNKSIDYTRKRYVEEGLYEVPEPSLGDAVSDYLATCLKQLGDNLRPLHAPEPSFGVFGAEITLFRIPHALDVARMLSNRGLLLEVLPTLRLCVEMMAWARTAFHLDKESEVVKLNASACIPELKIVYGTAGRVYGRLSTFSHWGHAVHRDFLTFERDKTGVLFASVKYRARALALCIVVLDIFVEVVRSLYPDRCEPVVKAIQGTLSRNQERELYKLVSQMVELTQLDELREVQGFLQV